MRKRNKHFSQHIYDYGFNKDTDSNNMNKVIIFIDEEKAFDRVDHSFSLETFEKSVIGDHFLSRIRTF